MQGKEWKGIVYINGKKSWREKKSRKLKRNVEDLCKKSNIKMSRNKEFLWVLLRIPISSQLFSGQ